MLVCQAVHRIVRVSLADAILALVEERHASRARLGNPSTIPSASAPVTRSSMSCSLVLAAAAPAQFQLAIVWASARDLHLLAASSAF